VFTAREQHIRPHVCGMTLSGASYVDPHDEWLARVFAGSHNRLRRP
jgi:hypothetical protein